MHDKHRHERTICERVYTTFGPFWIKPAGDPRKAKLFRVMVAKRRRLTKPLTRKEAGRLCDLLNEVFHAALSERFTLTFTGRHLDGIDFPDITAE
ncbi:hypothetical protein OT109_15025 [Phycisphaeraceae bacterium D3-23]